MVTVCADSVEELRKGKGKHGLEALMLSDRNLVAADALGLRNIGAMSAPRPVPVPTSVIVDASGIVQWIDQSEHYSDRSNRDLVMSALHEHLGIQ
jgi:peroxiredoxin